MIVRLFFGTIVVLSLMHPTMVSADQFDISPTQAVEIRDRVCIPYLNALKNGDVQTIIAYGGGELYQE